MDTANDSGSRDILEEVKHNEGPIDPMDTNKKAKTVN